MTRLNTKCYKDYKVNTDSQIELEEDLNNIAI